MYIKKFNRNRKNYSKVKINKARKMTSYDDALKDYIVTCNYELLSNSKVFKNKNSSENMI